MKKSRANEIYGAIWLIGLGILFLTDYFWPGILILVGMTMLVRALLPVDQDEKKDVFAEPVTSGKTVDETAPWEESESETGEDEEEDEPFEPAFIKPAEEKITGESSKLPEACPSCGGPVRENAHKVEWITNASYKCPFCETKLTIE